MPNDPTLGSKWPELIKEIAPLLPQGLCPVLTCLVVICYIRRWLVLTEGHRQRRAFIATLGCAAAWPLAVGAQQPDGVRCVALIFSLTNEDPEYQARGLP